MIERRTAPSAEAALPLLAGWVEMWMMPLTITARMLGMSDPTAAGDFDEPEIDRDCADGQLPVPNPLQKAKDSDLFA